MTLTFGSRRSNGRNDTARALGGNGTGIASTGRPPALAMTSRSWFASAVSVGPTSCPRSWLATVPWVTSPTEPAVPPAAHRGGGQKCRQRARALLGEDVIEVSLNGAEHRLLQMAVHHHIARPVLRRERRREPGAEECGVRAREAESRDSERDDRDSCFAWSEQQRKGAAEHGVDNDRIERGVAMDVAYPRALMRYRIGTEVLQSEADLGGTTRDVAAFGKTLVELPIVDVDLRTERDASRAGRLGSLAEHAPGMHDHFVAATNEVLGNRHQGQDVTGYRGSGDQKPRHVVLSLFLTHQPTRCSFGVAGARASDTTSGSRRLAK